MVFDGHSDIITDVTLRRLAGESDIIRKYHISRLRAGGVSGACFSIWIDHPYDQTPSKRLEQILAAAQAEFTECSDIVSVIRNLSELTESIDAGKLAVLLGMEGLSGIGHDLDRLHDLYDYGIRSCMLTWNELNNYAAGARCDLSSGLTDLGKRAVRLIQDKHMILDVSHLNERSFWDVMKVANAPVIASHSNAKALCHAARNVSDDQLIMIRDLDGIVGLNAYHGFVDERKENQHIDRLVEHAAYIADKIGTRHLAFGFDFFEFLPEPINGGEDHVLQGLESCKKIPALLKKMRKAGFTDREIEMISFGNWCRFIKRC